MAERSFLRQLKKNKSYKNKTWTRAKKVEIVNQTDKATSQTIKVNGDCKKSNRNN